ncbi:uncharacterized protein DFL_004792 [Arthrobotrys flagrans]|uniref:Uncharacterized protein n=1 Tax=Arthrobotrys flagrans TaxID=97331 RepID=A0A437A5L1_ARTFL|nr:hypothetical protein DFL_004792 [Arthrobotrys flagrans]
MPLLEPNEVVALGLSPKDIPAHKPRTRKSLQGAGHVGSTGARVTMSQTRRRAPTNHRNLISTSSRSSGKSTSNSSPSDSASPTLTASRFAFGAGVEVGSNFEVCIPIPSKRKLAVLQQYERFPDADMATDEEIARVGVEDAQDAGRENPVGENQPEAPEHSDEPNGSSGADIGIDTSDKQPVQGKLAFDI